MRIRTNSIRVYIKIDKGLYKIDKNFDSDSKWKQMGGFRFVIEYKVSALFCLKTARLSFVLKNVCLSGAFLKCDFLLAKLA